MSDYSRFISWDARCTDRGGYGMTPGDTMHLGLRDYNEMYPCPNGLPVQTGGPQASEAWQKRVKKAKQDIEEHTNQIAWKDAIEAAHVAWPSESVSSLIGFIERQYA
jgi:hypothetical protein